MNTTARTPRRASAATKKPAAARGTALLPGVTPSVALTLELLARGATPELITSVLAAKEREDKAAGAISYAQALSTFQAKNLQLLKTEHVHRITPEGEEVDYWYAPLPQVLDIVGPALRDCGLVYSFRPVEQTRDWITVACRLTHIATGYSEEVQMGGPPDETGDKAGAQSITSTETLLKRATLKAALGLAEVRDDSDGRQGSRSAPRAPAPAPAPVEQFLPPAEFARQLVSWRSLILSGRRSAEQVITTARTRTPLSPEQEAELRQIERASPVAA